MTSALHHAPAVDPATLVRPRRPASDRDILRTILERIDAAMAAAPAPAGATTDAGGGRR